VTRRALILAGGGIKVAYQAGVLQVWLDEAGLAFDHADGASGGCFNLAMWTQGMSGTQIADAWRNANPRMGVDPNWSEYIKFFWGESLFELDAYRKYVFPEWGLDFDAIRASRREATFNVYNFSKHELRIVEPREMTEDLLVASVSLPMWFPPVRIDGDTYIDSVFNTDANLEEAIRRGADEVWVIWTVSERGEWHDGFIGNYFGIIEAAANGRYRQVLQRIERGEFGRPIRVRELKAEVPLHYLINFSRDRVREAVNRGVEDARRWCAEQGIALTPSIPIPPPAQESRTSLQFTEDMKGYCAIGEPDPKRGYDRGRDEGSAMHAHMTIKVDDVDRFVAEPRHEAAIEGWVTSPFGERRPVERGVFNLFVDEGDPSKKRMLYRCLFTGTSGEPLTLSGEKLVEDDQGFDLWGDTTTLFVHIEENGAVRAAGIIRLTVLDLMKQLASFRVEGPTLGERTAAMARFGAFFLGRLWDVYARQVISYGPF